MKRLVGAAAAACVLAWAGAASAATLITTKLSGSITAGFNTDAYFGAASADLIGKSWSVAIDWDVDDTASDWYGGFHYLGTLPGSPLAMTLTIDGQEFQTSPSGFSAWQTDGQASYVVRGSDAGLFTYFSAVAQAATMGPHPMERISPIAASGTAFISLTAGSESGPALSTISFDVRQIEVVSPLPEPGTWAMMIIGFGLAGSVLRRRNHPLYVS